MELAHFQLTKSEFVRYIVWYFSQAYGDIVTLSQ